MDKKIIPFGDTEIEKTQILLSRKSNFDRWCRYE